MHSFRKELMHKEGILTKGRTRGESNEKVFSKLPIQFREPTSVI